MDIKIVGQEKLETTQDKAPEQVQGPEGFDIKAMGQVMGLDENEYGKYDDKLQTLLEYAKLKTDDHSPEGLKWAIRSLELKLNTPDIGEKLIDYITRYAYLELEGMKIEAEKKKFNGY